jgi:hypothetical protein
MVLFPFGFRLLMLKIAMGKVSNFPELDLALSPIWALTVKAGLGFFVRQLSR